MQIKLQWIPCAIWLPVAQKISTVLFGSNTRQQSKTHKQVKAFWLRNSIPKHIFLRTASAEKKIEIDRHKDVRISISYTSKWLIKRQMWFCCLVAKSCPALFPSLGLSMGFSRQEYWSGCHSLLQGISRTQGSNTRLLPHFLHFRRVLYSWATRGSPNNVMGDDLESDFLWWVFSPYVVASPQIALRESHLLVVMPWWSSLLDAE